MSGNALLKLLIVDDHAAVRRTLRQSFDALGVTILEAGSGEEAVGGSVATPDQDIVENLGRAAGVTYEDNEELNPVEKVKKRDRKRWELNPSSSEDYQERLRGR